MNYFIFLIICWKFNIISNSFLFSLLIFHVFRKFFKFNSVVMHDEGFFCKCMAEHNIPLLVAD